ncbi:hypothetical protein skT53_25260 [Effusibacillus dendaii]|uniref:Major facilitator superfamily (MFS) profile domain-containing protein n=1 Tax=Effusibacillus dendaii TaxID=2743772 RepID=A0A7I8DI66_9BACL|nr:hypothetical protein skT53_25260 [Effusibacillus dendaii]
MRLTSWQGVFIVLSMIGVVMLLAVLFGLPETLPIQSRSKGGIKNTLATVRNLVTDRVFMGYAFSQGLVVAAMFAYISGSPFVLQDIYGVSPQMFSLLFAIHGLGIIIASQVTGRLAGRIDETKLLVGAGLFAILPPLFVVVSSVGIVTTAGFSLAMQIKESQQGRWRHPVLYAPHTAAKFNVQVSCLQALLVHFLFGRGDKSAPFHFFHPLVGYRWEPHYK